MPYNGCDELLAYYRTELARTTSAYDSFPPPPGRPDRRESTAMAAAEGSAAVPDPLGSGPTGTNVQERGVDEPDSAKLVGDLLFTFSGASLQIVRTGTTPDLLASFPLGAPAYGAELLVQLLPVSTYDEGTGRNEAVGVRVGADGSLERAGRLALGPDVQVERVLHDRDHIYAVTRTGVVAARAGDFTRTGSVAFPR